MSISIELAVEADAEEIHHLQLLAFQTEAILYGPNIPPLKQSLDELRADFKIKLMLKAIDASGMIVGSARAWISDKGRCHIEKLMVHPDNRRQGIATKMLRRIEDEFPKAKVFELFTGELSHGNQALYKSVGYREFK